MRPVFLVMLLLACFSALSFCAVRAGRFSRDRQFGFRDAGHYYYPLHARVQKEWNEHRWPLWEPEENGGMPLLGNPTAAVLYPGKVVFAVLPYKWAARIYIVAHSVLAFAAMLILMRSWGISWAGCGCQCTQLHVRCTDPVSVLQYHLPGRRRLASAGNSCRRSLGPAGPALGDPGAGGRSGNAGARWRPAVRLPARDRGARLRSGASRHARRSAERCSCPTRRRHHRSAAGELRGQLATGASPLFAAWFAATVILGIVLPKIQASPRRPADTSPALDRRDERRRCSPPGW